MLSARFHWLVFVFALVPVSAHATKPKLDSDTCAQLRAEEKKFRQTGILNDMGKGPEWAKANLSAERLREVQHYIELDEQVQFGCRDARLSVDALKASAAAERIEINSDADPTIPVVKDPVKPGSTPAVPAAVKKPPANKTTRKKPKTGDPKSGGLQPAEKAASPRAAAAPVVPPSVADGTGSTSGAAAQSSGVSGGQGTNQLMFGFGETMVLPHSNP